VVPATLEISEKLWINSFFKNKIQNKIEIFTKNTGIHFFFA